MWPVASSSAASAHGVMSAAGRGAGPGIVSRMKHSSAATIAAASSGEAAGATISSFGRRLTMGGSSQPAGRYRIMPAPTVSLLDSSMRMNDPVARLRA